MSRCDHCNKVIEVGSGVPDGWTTIIVKGPDYRYSPDGSSGEYYIAHVCNECRKEFDEFMNYDRYKDLPF